MNNASGERCPSLVDVVVVAYRGRRWLPECIRTLRTAANRLRLILVDNGEHNGISDLDLSGMDHVVLRTPRSMGFADANNFALVHSERRAPAVCFLNQDTQGVPSWLNECVQLFDAYPKLGAVSPMLRTYDGKGWDPAFCECCRQNSSLSERMQGRQIDEPLVPVALATAAALVVRTDVLGQVGPFDPIYGSYYEDYDLCSRIKQAGFEIAVATRATVHHYSGSSTVDQASQRKRMRQIIRNRVIYGLRQPGRRRWVELARELGQRLPRNLVRGIARTPSSQPPIVHLRAHYDLLRLASRILSTERDQQAWRMYLDSIGWTPTNFKLGGDQ